MAVLRGWRFVGFVSCIVGAVGLTLYPVIVDPMLNTEKYKTLQEYSKIKRDVKRSKEPQLEYVNSNA